MVSRGMSSSFPRRPLQGTTARRSLTFEEDRCPSSPPPADETLRMPFEQPDILSAQETENRNRWNFDFINGVPLEGRYEWILVGANSLPEYYSRKWEMNRNKFEIKYTSASTGLLPSSSIYSNVSHESSTPWSSIGGSHDNTTYELPRFSRAMDGVVSPLSGAGASNTDCAEYSLPGISGDGEIVDSVTWIPCRPPTDDTFYPLPRTSDEDIQFEGLLAEGQMDTLHPVSPSSDVDQSLRRDSHEQSTSEDSPTPAKKLKKSDGAESSSTR